MNLIFTLGTILALDDMMIRFMGISHEICRIKNKPIKEGYKFSPWINNGMIFCVSTIHCTGQMIKRIRRKPRKTIKNQEHVDKVWGSNSKTKVYIPKLIDDYNRWMRVVDLVDHHIAFYHPNVRCRRKWLPMFIQLLSFIRTNSYIVHKKYFGKKSFSHKKITLDMISYFMKMTT